MAKTVKPKRTKKTTRVKRTVIEGVNVPLLHELVKQSGMSQRAIGRLIGLQPGGSSRLFAGTLRLKLEKVGALAKALSQPQELILEAFGAAKDELKDSRSQVLVKGWLDGSMIMRVEGLRGRHTTSSSHNPKTTGALRFQTAGSEYGYWDGGLVFYRLAGKTKVPADWIGALALVQVAGSDALKLRVIKRGYSAGRYDLANLVERVLETDVALVQAFQVLEMTTRPLEG